MRDPHEKCGVPQCYKEAHCGEHVPLAITGSESVTAVAPPPGLPTVAAMAAMAVALDVISDRM